jgi:hypothetical protein
MSKQNHVEFVGVQLSLAQIEKALLIASFIASSRLSNQCHSTMKYHYSLMIFTHNEIRLRSANPDRQDPERSYLLK